MLSVSSCLYPHSSFLLYLAMDLTFNFIALESFLIYLHLRNISKNVFLTFPFGGGRAGFVKITHAFSYVLEKLSVCLLIVCLLILVQGCAKVKFNTTLTILKKHIIFISMCNVFFSSSLCYSLSLISLTIYYCFESGRSCKFF